MSHRIHSVRCAYAQLLLRRYAAVRNQILCLRLERTDACSDDRCSFVFKVRAHSKINWYKHTKYKWYFLDEKYIYSQYLLNLSDLWRNNGACCNRRILISIFLLESALSIMTRLAPVIKYYSSKCVGRHPGSKVINIVCLIKGYFFTAIEHLCFG